MSGAEPAAKNKKRGNVMIIERAIGPGKTFKVDTDTLEFDKKGKLVKFGEVKIPGKKKMDKGLLQSLIAAYDLVEINGHYYHAYDIIGFQMGGEITVKA